MALLGSCIIMGEYLTIIIMEVLMELAADLEQRELRDISEVMRLVEVQLFNLVIVEVSLLRRSLVPMVQRNMLVALQVLFMIKTQE